MRLSRLFAVPPMLFWTFHSLGKNLTDTVVTRREHILVATVHITGFGTRFTMLFSFG